MVVVLCRKFGGIVSLPTADDFYHTGLVVDDLEAVAAEMSRTFGYVWTKPGVGDVPIITPDGPAVIPMKFTYSVQQPIIELLETVPGTIITPGDRGTHHLGYWTDDVAAASQALADVGYPIAAAGTDADGNISRFAYHLTPTGVYLELVDRMIFGQPLEAWLATTETIDDAD